LINSRLGRFTATVMSFGGEPLHPRRHTFSRSYGVNLPSSFAGDHSSALGFSPRLPVSDYGTVSVSDPHRGFSRRHGVGGFAARRPRDHASAFGMRRWICLPSPPTRFNPHFQSRARLSFRVTPGSTPHGGTGMLTCFPSTTPFGLALGTD
jgi:hypothetical protein